MESIGPYEIRGELGRGAMAVVWRAWDPKLEREIALKEPLIGVTVDPVLAAEFSERFVREARTAARLSHPGIVTIYDAETYEGRPVIAMELVEGSTLAVVLDSGRLDAAGALAVLSQLLAVAGYAHSQGVVHRDIKPDNIFITPDGRIKLADFGIAHLGGGSTLTQAGTIMGTPGYMSPEQVTGQPVDARSDIFSIGVVGYEMLAGRNPFGAGEGAEATTVMYRIVHEQPEPLAVLIPDLPGSAGAVIAKAMEKDPVRRYSVAAQMQTDLASGRTPLLAGAAADAALSAGQMTSGTTSKVIVGVAALAVVILGVLLVLAISGGPVSGGGTGGRTATVTAPPGTGAVTLAEPKDGASVSFGGSIPVRVEVAASGVVAVEVQVNGEVMRTLTVAPYRYDFQPSGPGSYNIRAVARTGSGGRLESGLARVDVVKDAVPTVRPKAVSRVSAGSVAYARSLGGTSHEGEHLFFVVGASEKTEAIAQSRLDKAIPLFGDMQSYFVIQRSDELEGMSPGWWVVVEAYKAMPTQGQLAFGKRGFSDAYVKSATVRTSNPIPVYEDIVGP